MVLQNIRVARALLIPAFLLLVPLVAMQFTHEVQWTAFDFVFMYILLAGCGLVYVQLTKNMANSAYKFGVGVAAVAVLMLIWVNGAVGIIGDEGNQANMLYMAVPAIGLLGIALSRFKARGLSHTAFAMALAQTAVPVIAYIIWRPLLSEPPGLAGVLMLNAGFVGLFIFSGLLFRHASTQKEQ